MDPNTAHRIATDAAQRILDCEDQQDRHCRTCGAPVESDRLGAWVDKTLGDCCPVTNEPHNAAVDEVTEDERGPSEFAVDLATAWQSLDAWITRGGFVPRVWQSRNPLAPRTQLYAGQTIEDLIDTHGLASVLRTIENVCHEKAEHIAHAWQDHTLARDWTKAAGLIARTASRLNTLNPTAFGE